MVSGHTKAEFGHFIEEYYSRCIQALPSIDVVGAKWPYRSMIPDLSDFDGRIIARDGTSPAQWQVLDTAIGGIHYEMVTENPEWSRFLEHPVGICVTWKETLADDIYHPETVFWSCLMGDKDRHKDLQRRLRNKPWDDRQEYYYLHRFLTYYSPYIHDIDPPQNLGAWEKHYALHSRCLHYFVPGMQAALCLIKKKAVCCKFETIYGWKDLLPDEEIFDRILDMVEVSYDVPELHDEALMLKFEDELFECMKKAMAMVREVVTIIDMRDGADAGECKKRIAKFSANPLMQIFNGVRFSRVRKGRYEFYLREPKPFDSEWLIANEFAWLRNFFTRTVMRSYGQLKCGEDDASLDTIIEAMKPDLIDNAGERVIRTVYNTTWESFEACREREMLQRIAPMYGDYYLILESILSDAREISSNPPGAPEPQPDLVAKS